MNSEKLLEIIRGKSAYHGLSVAEAADGLQVYGQNVRDGKPKKLWFRRLYEILTEPMMILIIAAAFIYYFTGDRIEAVIFFCSIIPIALIQFFQQRRTDRAVAELDKLLESQCKVYRGGRLITENIKYLVPGDLVYLSAGDKIPADGFILSGSGLMIDESVMTGESSPVAKKVIAEKDHEAKNGFKLFQGTLVVQGEGDMIVYRTGAKTEYSQVGSLLEKIIKGKTPLQNKINRLIKSLAVIAIAAVIAVGLILTARQGWHEGLIGALAMGMSLIPEEFPIVFSVFLIMGVWRMAKKNALVRQMVTVETLGAATVICTDKTGTLTEGRMSIEKIYAYGKHINPHSEDDKDLLKQVAAEAVLSLERIALDPLEIEMQRYAKEIGVDPEKLYGRHEILDDSPFDAETKMLHHLWKERATGRAIQYSVGAPESIISISRLDDARKNELLKINEEMAGAGLRVVAWAKRAGDKKIVAQELEFCGLLAMSDPPRARAKEAVGLCQGAGIRVVMITGDNRLTALSVAKKIGMINSDTVINGEDFAKMSPAAMRKAVSSVSIFARVRPEHKFLIIEALKQNGEIVAMTGDGVNDAPALKRADIGIAMGKKGTEVAREASDMILLDDEFFTIARAVKEGRKIYHNLQRAFAFLISFHIPIIGMALVPVIFGEPLIFLPIHIIFLELICDPASVIGFENEKAPRNVMRFAPRKANESIIPPPLWLTIIIQGLVIFALSFASYWYFGHIRGDLALGRTFAFTALVISQVALVFVTREWFQIKNNITLTSIGIVTLFFLAVICFTPALRALFHFSFVSPAYFALIFLCSFIIMGVTAFFSRLARS